MSVFDNIGQQEATQYDESQFILRLPPLVSASLRAALKSGVQNLKERLSIQFEADMRNASVKFDGWSLPGKLMDLPTITECLKTLDNKTFYKTADISQILICKEDGDDIRDEPEELVRKTKDGKEKRYLYPHGITKPLKNVRKKRFRKMLKKKNVDMAEIEKEVKRLLRTDNEAKSVRFEIVSEDASQPGKFDSMWDGGQSMDASDNFNNSNMGDSFVSGDALAAIKPDGSFDNYGSSAGGASSSAGPSSSGHHKKSAPIHTEQDLFGDELSSSDDDNQ